jgi:hypothetical protein
MTTPVWLPRYLFQLPRGLIIPRAQSGYTHTRIIIKMEINDKQYGT